MKTILLYLLLISSPRVFVFSTTIMSWDELDQRTNPEWYDDAKFGIFIHWGLYSVPSFGSEWFGSYWKSQWGNNYQEYNDFIAKTEKANFAYSDYAHRFLAELYKPEYWAQVFAKAGAQYVVMTSKHHEGYCMWNSTSIATTWQWNVMDVGPRRDLLGDLEKQVRKQTSPHTQLPLKFGIYHSAYEWFNPLYIQDRNANFTKQDFVNFKTLPELYDLVNRYNVDIVWSDGQWEAHSDYWKAREFLQWYGYNSSAKSTAVWNDRWGTDTLCKHGSFITCDDRYSPTDLQPEKWEQCLTIDTTSWGYNRNATYEDYLSTESLIHSLITVVARNGNMLLDVGPSSDGTIHPIFVDRLLGIGEWLKVNGESIYGTRPWPVCQNETDVFYTKKDDTLYALMTAWPRGSTLSLECPIATRETSARLLGWDESLQFERNPGDSFKGVSIQLPQLTPDLVPCDHAWVIALDGIRNI